MAARKEENLKKSSDMGVGGRHLKPSDLYASVTTQGTAMLWLRITADVNNDTPWSDTKV